MSASWRISRRANKGSGTRGRKRITGRRLANNRSLAVGGGRNSLMISAGALASAAADSWFFAAVPIRLGASAPTRGLRGDLLPRRFPQRELRSRRGWGRLDFVVSFRVLQVPWGGQSQPSPTEVIGGRSPRLGAQSLVDQPRRGQGSAFESIVTPRHDGGPPPMPL